MKKMIFYQGSVIFGAVLLSISDSRSYFKIPCGDLVQLLLKKVEIVIIGPTLETIPMLPISALVRQTHAKTTTAGLQRRSREVSVLRCRSLDFCTQVPIQLCFRMYRMPRLHVAFPSGRSLFQRVTMRVN
eukprot:Rmarinus@m.23107